MECLGDQRKPRRHYEYHTTETSDKSIVMLLEFVMLKINVERFEPFYVFSRTKWVRIRIYTHLYQLSYPTINDMSMKPPEVLKRRVPKPVGKDTEPEQMDSPDDMITMRPG